MPADHVRVKNVPQKLISWRKVPGTRPKGPVSLRGRPAELEGSLDACHSLY